MYHLECFVLGWIIRSQWRYCPDIPFNSSVFSKKTSSVIIFIHPRTDGENSACQRWWWRWWGI